MSIFNQIDYFWHIIFTFYSKIMKNIFYFLSITFIATSCGKSIDKNSFEGRVASYISQHQGSYMAFSMDLKNIIEKSGIEKGAIPEQYLNTIKPYMDALKASINLEKQVFVIPTINTKNIDQSEFLVLFDIKNADRLKKEFKEMGVSLKKKGNLEFGIKPDATVGLFNGETGFILFSDGAMKVNEEMVVSMGKELAKGATIEGVVDFVTLKSDITAFYTGDKMSSIDFPDVPELSNITKSMNELYKGTYWIAQVSFEKQEARMEIDIHFGDKLDEYAPFLRDKLSKEAVSVAASGSTFFAMAFNMDFGNFFNMIFEQLDQKTKDELNKQLSMLGGTDKFKQLLTGEFAMAMSMPEEDLKFNVFAGTGDRKQIQSMLDGFGFFLGITKSGDTYEMDGNLIEFTDKGIVIASSQADLKAIKSGNSPKSRKMGDFEFGAMPVSMFVDFGKMGAFADYEELKYVTSVFDYAYFQSDGYKSFGLIRSFKSNQNILRTMIESAIEVQRLEIIRVEREAREYEEMYDDIYFDEYSDENTVESEDF